MMFQNNDLINNKEIQKSYEESNPHLFHKRIKGVFDFMRTLSNTKIYEKIVDENEHMFDSIYTVYLKFLEMIRNEVEKNKSLNSDLDATVHEINNHLIKNYLKLNKYEKSNSSKYKSLDEQLNKKLHSLRKSDFENLLEVPKHMKNHPIWDKAINELEFIKNLVVPKDKINCMIR